MFEKEFVIRKAEVKDEEEIYTIQERAIREICSQSYAPEQIDMWVFAANKNIKWVLHKIESGLYHFYVAEKKGQVIGFASLFMNLEILSQNNIEYFCDLDELYVNPNCLQQGVGTNLLITLENVGKDKGCKRIFAYPFLNSVSFLQKFGYQVKEKTCYLRHRNIEINRFNAEKYL